MPDVNLDYLTLLLDQYWFAPPVALWRAVELRVLAAEPFVHPILDLGCGDGLIAQVLFKADKGARSETGLSEMGSEIDAGKYRAEAPIDVGFDPWWAQLRQASASGMYKHVQQALGDTLPYPDGMFATVFSNSVLEHIPDLPPVLQEVARVLRPGGRFLATVPSDAFRKLLAGYKARAAAGDFAGAEAYATAVDRQLEHYRYPSPAQWAEWLSGVGIRLVSARYYIPAEVVALWDESNRTYGIYKGENKFSVDVRIRRWLASPRLRRLGYQRILRRWVTRTLSRRWRAAYEQDVPANGVGGGLLIVGEK
ncbi:MAG: methyltransferase domain-containing protein [Anaerolineae bacterium]|nr:methyltransferase domain-containing protein [Anaerolineae bacterium]